MAWPTSFHSEGELCAKQRLDTRIPARSALGTVAPSPATARARYTARSSGGSPRASDALTAAITVASRCTGGPAGTIPAASAGDAVATVGRGGVAVGLGFCVPIVFLLRPSSRGEESSVTGMQRAGWGRV
jgi:hypothetical protein